MGFVLDGRAGGLPVVGSSLVPDRTLGSLDFCFGGGMACFCSRDVEAGQTYCPVWIQLL